DGAHRAALQNHSSFHGRSLPSLMPFIIRQSQPSCKGILDKRAFRIIIILLFFRHWGLESRGFQGPMFVFQGGQAMLVKFLVCVLAGLGAGIGTGLAGLSAAAVISPMLVTFLGFPSYQAVAISLASDVLASAVSAYTYGRHKNLDIKNGSLMLGVVLVLTLVGSLVAFQMPNDTMSTFSVLMTLVLGLRFIICPVTGT